MCWDSMDTSIFGNSSLVARTTQSRLPSRLSFHFLWLVTRAITTLWAIDMLVTFSVGAVDWRFCMGTMQSSSFLIGYWSPKFWFSVSFIVPNTYYIAIYAFHWSGKTFWQQLFLFMASWTSTTLNAVYILMFLIYAPLTFPSWKRTRDKTNY